MQSRQSPSLFHFTRAVPPAAACLPLPIESCRRTVLLVPSDSSLPEVPRHDDVVNKVLELRVVGAGLAVCSASIAAQRPIPATPFRSTASLAKLSSERNNPLIGRKLRSTPG